MERDIQLPGLMGLPAGVVEEESGARGLEVEEVISKDHKLPV